MKTYLVESWSPEIEFDCHSTIVALTPEVCYQLDKAGVEYSIIEDYYNEAELAALEDEYHKSQIEWIKNLDEFLQSNIEELRELKLRMATIYYYYLKTMVLDPLYIRCYTLNKLIEMIKPTNVVFISYPGKVMSLDFRLECNGESLYSQIIPILCQESSIQFTALLSEPDNGRLKVTKSVDTNIITQLRKKLGKFRIIRMVYSFGKTFRQKSFLVKRPANNKLKILMLKLGYEGKKLVEEALDHGYRVYEFSDDWIIECFSGRTKKHLNLKEKYECRLAELDINIWEKTAILLDGHELTKWINERCRATVHPIVLPRLKYFISDLCPQILSFFKTFKEFCENEKIDFVLTPHEFSLTDFAAVAAANSCRHTKSVLIYHGADLFANKMWDITELSHFDIHITPEKELKEYLEYRCELNNIPTELYYSISSGLLDVGRKRHLSRKQKGVGKERVIYLPTVFMGDNRRYDGANYPDVWYYKFQKSLIEYFSTKSEYTFVWKGLPMSDAIYNPIPNFIKDNNFSNIEIATNPFVEHIPSADKVICDHPSTGLYESIVAGVPTMCLYHNVFKLRKSAVAHFGNLLKLFADLPEAIKHIDEFLTGDQELYKMKLETGDKSTLQILEKVAGREN